ncbi:hypothetical protein RYX36_033901 [Vicia faba]
MTTSISASPSQLRRSQHHNHITSLHLNPFHFLSVKNHHLPIQFVVDSPCELTFQAIRKSNLLSFRFSSIQSKHQHNKTNRRRIGALPTRISVWFPFKDDEISEKKSRGENSNA